jgi:glycosyltransferase involved in cell wall biosynthesis
VNATFEPVDRAAIEAAMPILPGPGSIPQEQMHFPLRHFGDTVVSLCNVTPLLAKRAIVWIHDAHIFEAPDSYGRFYRYWHTVQLRGSGLRGYQIVTVSNYSKERLIAHGAPADRIKVLYNGGDHILRAVSRWEEVKGLGLDDVPFALVLGSPAKHKNMAFALQALLRGLPDSVKIAVVGLHQIGAYTESDGIPVHPRIVRLPRVSDDALRALYERTSVTVIPSLLEGFGLPAAEALWCGSPLAISDKTALPEVGGDAAVLFDPSDAEDMAAKVRLAMEPETSARLREAAVSQREKFQWRSTALRLIEMV